MMQIIKEIGLPLLLPVVTALCGYMTWAMQQSRKINDANAKGTMLLLRREIINYHKRCCKQGEGLTTFDFNDMTEIHDAYKALGGNGLTDKMYDDLMALDIKHGE